MATSKRSKITVQGIEIGIETIEGQDFLSLTDIVRTQESDFVLYSWLKNHDAIDFLAIWESQHNPLFQRAGYDAIKTRLHEKRFTLSPSKWAEATGARGIFSKKGKHGGGTFVHEDIALEFCSWLSPVFKFYVLTEFKRLKTEEAARLDRPIVASGGSFRRPIMPSMPTRSGNIWCHFWSKGRGARGRIFRRKPIF